MTTKAVTKQTSLLHELAVIMRDYAERIEKLGLETLRLRGESFGEERKRRRIDLVLELLEAAVRADDEGKLDELLQEVAKTPEQHVPPELLRPPPEPICSRCLRREKHHGPGGVDDDCPDGFVTQADPPGAT